MEKKPTTVEQTTMIADDDWRSQNDECITAERTAALEGITTKREAAKTTTLDRGAIPIVHAEGSKSMILQSKEADSTGNDIVPGSIENTMYFHASIIITPANKSSKAYRMMASCTSMKISS
jgi:hypothetical protein